MINKGIWIGIIIGLIFAIPFFVILLTLEEGVYTGDDGICPHHRHENQMAVGVPPRICDNVKARGIVDGEIQGGGFTCIDGVYYKTNYHCITKNLGLFIESEGEGNPLILIWWVILMEFYGILVGGSMGFVVSKITKRDGERKPLDNGFRLSITIIILLIILLIGGLVVWYLFI